MIADSHAPDTSDSVQLSDLIEQRIAVLDAKANVLLEELALLRQKTQVGGREDGDAQRLDEINEQGEALSSERNFLQSILRQIKQPEQMFNQYAPLIAQVIRTAPDKALPILKALVASFVDTAEGLNEEMVRLDAHTAKRRHQQFLAYHKAGFSIDQSIALVLASIKPVDVLGQLKQNASRPAQSRSRD